MFTKAPFWDSSLLLCYIAKRFNTSVQSLKEFSEENAESLKDGEFVDTLDSDGYIVAVGAIIKINAGSSGGGRLAAAKQLSEYGVAIKISADGTIEGFSYDKNTSTSKAIFSAG